MINRNLPQLCDDVLIKIFSYLDLFSLYFVCRTNKYLSTIAKSDLLWEKHLFDHFEIANNNKKTKLFTQFFKTYNNYYKGMYITDNKISKIYGTRHDNLTLRKCFTYVRANDLSKIKENYIYLDFDILNLPDNKSHTLLSLVRKQNNPELNTYIFEQIDGRNYYKFRHDEVLECTDKELLELAIYLDQTEEIVAELFNGQETNEDKIDSMFFATKYDSINSAEFLLKIGYVTTPSLLQELLYDAVENSAFKMIDLLLKQGANINEGFLFNNNTTIDWVLFLAVRNNQLKMVKHLVNKGADVNFQYMTNNAFQIAVQENHIEIYQYLLQHNIDNGKDGYTELHFACHFGLLSIVKKLCEAGENINSLTFTHITPLYIASRNGYKDIVEFLLKNGADVDFRFKNGNTILHAVCSDQPNYYLGNYYNYNHHNIAPIIKLLIQAGADPLASNLYGQTPAKLVQNNHDVRDDLFILENLALANMDDLTIPNHHVVDTQFIINAIKNLLMYFTDKITVKDARLCLKLLENTSTSFGCAVVVYSFFNKENQNSTISIFAKNDRNLISCLLKVLNFESKNAAKNSLYSIIFSSLGNHNEILLAKLKEFIIQPIIAAFNGIGVEDELLRASNTSMLCLNLLEVKIKKTKNELKELNVKQNKNL